MWAHKKLKLRRLGHTQGLWSQIRAREINQGPQDQSWGQNLLWPAHDQVKRSKAQARVAKVMLKHSQAQGAKKQENQRPFEAKIVQIVHILAGLTS